MESLAAAYVEHDVEKFVPNPRESKVPNVKKKQREERVPDRADECTDTAFKGPFGRMNTSVNQGGSISEEMLASYLVKAEAFIGAVEEDSAFLIGYWRDCLCAVLQARSERNLAGAKCAADKPTLAGTDDEGSALHPT